MDDTQKDLSFSPPANEAELVDWVRLWRSRRVGPATFRRLMAEHGRADAALAALPEIARDAGVENYSVADQQLALDEIRRGRMVGAALIPLGDPRYPVMLKGLPDAPPLLWALGDLTFLKRPMVAVVGARNCSSLGLRMARRLGQDLAKEGYLVVSGLARGVDTAAHEGAGPAATAAVHAGGVDVVYPAENAALAQQIERQGLRLSENPPGARPLARNFLARNRIISGMARAVVVVEAAAKSGSLTTARNALDQGREVLAVPGNPMDPRSSGCNMLIRDGATLIRSANDVMEVIGPPLDISTAAFKVRAHAPEVPQNPVRSRDQLQSLILSSLSNGPKTTDQLIQGLKQPASQVSPMLAMLETSGTIVRKSGGVMQLS